MCLPGFVRDPAEARPSRPSRFPTPAGHLWLKDSPENLQVLRNKTQSHKTLPETSKKLLLIYEWDAKGPASGEVGIFKGCRILGEGIMVNDGRLFIMQCFS